MTTADVVFVRSCAPFRAFHSQCAVSVTVDGLQAPAEPRKPSLLLGHAHIRKNKTYTRAGPSVKLEALEAMVAPKMRSVRFKETGKAIASQTAHALVQSATPPRSRNGLFTFGSPQKGAPHETPPTKNGRTS